MTSKTYLTSFATEDFKYSQEVLKCSSLVNGGVDYVINWNDKSPEIVEFIKQNHSLFYKDGKITRGFGFWSWQPFITLKTMELMNYGDVLIYMDSAINVIRDINDIISLSREKGILLFKLGEHSNKDYSVGAGRIGFRLVPAMDKEAKHEGGRQRLGRRT